MCSLFQSTHPRGVRPLLRQGRWSWNDVSIHAPAWGATRHLRRGSSRWWGFNPRTRVGCDEFIRHGLLCAVRFQSTHPRGVRLLHFFPGIFEGIVSIHAPAWGATPSTPTSPDRIPVFQSTHPRGVRPRMLWVCSRLRRCFNPRTRVGCDVRQRLPAARIPTSFNPRTRVGCDHGRQPYAPGHAEFQSTHPRGVRRRAAT